MTPINGHSHYHSRVKGSFQGKQNGQSPPSAAAAAPDGRRFPQRDAWLSELSQELASITKVVLDSLEQVAPTQVIEHGREQFAGCSVSVPAPTLTAMYAALRMLQEVAENVPAYMQPLGHRDPLHEVVEDVFDIGDLLQTVGDTLSGLAATKGVELVIYHGDDSHTKDGSQTIKAVDSRSVYVQGNETGLLFVLVHVRILLRPDDMLADRGADRFPHPNNSRQGRLNRVGSVHGLCKRLLQHPRPLHYRHRTQILRPRPPANTES